MSKGTMLLCLAALGLLMIGSSRATAQTPKRYTVTDYGAVGDGTTVNTKAIQALIERVSTDGGGVVVVPSGTFMTGALFFKKGVSLEVLKDGVLKGTTVQADYPTVNTRFEGIERPYSAALLNWDGVDNITLSGEGTIDGSGDLWMNRGGGAPGGNRGRGPTTAPAGRGAGALLPPAGDTAVASVIPVAAPGGARGARGAGGGAAGRGPATTPTTRMAPGPGRPRLICISNSTNIKVSNLHLTKQAIWCLHLLYDSNVTVDNVNIRAVARIPSSDGIDVDSSNHVNITHCDIACNDDDIALKSGKDSDGRRVNKPTEYVNITDCTIGAGEGIAMGSEVTGGIRHIVIERCKFDGSNQVVRLKSQPSRGGDITDITYRDCQFNNVRLAFEFTMNWDMRLETEPAAAIPTQVRNVHVINCNGSASQLGSMVGLDDTEIEDVHWSGCKVTAQRGMTIQHATNIDLSGLSATVASGQPFNVQNGNAITYPTTQPAAAAPGAGR